VLEILRTARKGEAGGGGLPAIGFGTLVALGLDKPRDAGKEGESPQTQTFWMACSSVGLRGQEHGRLPMQPERSLKEKEG